MSNLLVSEWHLTATTGSQVLNLCHSFGVPAIPPKKPEPWNLTQFHPGKLLCLHQPCPPPPTVWPTSGFDLPSWLNKPPLWTTHCHPAPWLFPVRLRQYLDDFPPLELECQHCPVPFCNPGPSRVRAPSEYHHHHHHPGQIPLGPEPQYIASLAKTFHMPMAICHLHLPHIFSIYPAS